MMSEPTSGGPAVYELTVAGALGPVLRAALQPHDTCKTEACTVMRAGAADHRDIVDLVRLLDSKGLRVEGVSRIAGGA